MRRVACASISIGVACALSLASSPAHAGDPAAAREQVKLGYQLAQAGKCDEAIPHFQESLRLDAKAITLINLAACEEKTTKLADALGHWVEARAKAQAEGNAAIEEEAEKKAKALEARVPKLTIALPGTPADTEVLRDGVTLGAASMGVPLPVNPGAHVLVVKSKEFEDTTENVTIAEGEQKRVELKLGTKKKPVAVAPPPSGGGAPTDGTEPRGLSPLVYVGFAVAAVGVGVGSVTGIMTLGKGSDAKTACPGGACKDQAAADDAKSGKTLGTISTIAFIVGGAGAAVGIYGLFFAKPRSTGATAAPSSNASIDVVVGPMGGGLRGTF